MKLSRRKVLSAAIGGVAGMGMWGLARQHHVQPITRTSAALGSRITITVIHPDPFLAERAIDAALAEVESVESVLSIYRPDSQVGELNRGVAILAHAHLRAVLNASLGMSRLTEGAFDVTIQPLWELHARTAREGRAPSVEEIDEAKRTVNWRFVEMEGNRVRLRHRKTRITFNGIAQGYATDRATATLLSHGIQHALVDVGELAAVGDKSAQTPWSVGIQHPRKPESLLAVAKLRDRCLATSGDYESRLAADSLDHHIFDPATGHSPTQLASVSVAAPTAMQADALSTALFVTGVERGLQIAKSLCDVDALFVLKNGRQFSTAGFPT